MAKLSESQFKKEISSAAYKTVYLIYGEEKYLVKHYTNLLTVKVAGKNPSEFDFVKFNSDTPIEEIYSSAEQISMFSEYKCICVSDYDINALSEKDFKQLDEFCSSLDFGTVLVFTMPTLSFQPKKKTSDSGKNNKFKKFASSIEKYGTVLELEKLSDTALERQLINWAEKNGAKLTKSNAAKIISRTGTDLTALRNEIAKLSAYADGKEITAEIIDELCIKNNESRIFSLTDYISKNNFGKSYEQLEILFEQNEKPEIILSVMSSVYIDMYRMRAASESGKNIEETARDFKYGKREFVLKNALSYSKNYSTNALRKALDVILQTDIKLKSTRTDPKILLETLVAQLIIIVRDGVSA